MGLTNLHAKLIAILLLVTLGASAQTTVIPDKLRIKTIPQSPLSGDMMVTVDASGNIKKDTIKSGSTTTHSLSFTYGFLGQPFSFNGSVPVSSQIDTTKLQTILNFFPKGDTRYLKSSTASTTYALQSTTLTINGTTFDLSANRTWSAGTVTSITPGYGFTSSTPITGSGTMTTDTTKLQTILNFFPKGDTRYYKSSNPSNYISRTGISATSPIFYNNSTGVISSQAATTSQNGYLTNTDWTTFNGKQSNLYVINIIDYGAVGDSTTDNTTAIRNAIAACTNSNGCKIIIPAGEYIVSDTLLVTKAVTFEGYGGINPVYSGTQYNHAVSQLVFTSTTKNGVYVNADNVMFDNLSITNNQTTPTAGAGIYVKKSIGFRMQNCSILNFYNDFDIENGWDWSIHDNLFYNSHHWNVKVADANLVDAGDQAFYANWLYGNTNTLALIRYENGGGLKIWGNKLNGTPGSSYPTGIDIAINASTADCKIFANSIENFTVAGIFSRCTTTFPNLQINDNQISTGVDAQCIFLRNNTNVNVANNVLANSNSTKYLIDVDSCGTTYIGVNNFSGYAKTLLYGTNNYNNPTILRNRISSVLSGTSVTFDIDKTSYNVYTLTGNSTLGFSNFVVGDRGDLIVIQDATGGRTLTFTGATVTGTLNTAANAINYIKIEWIGAPYVFINM